MILVPNETAWLLENVAKFSRTTVYDTPHGPATELEIMVCIPMKESHRFGGDTEAIGASPADGTGENRDLGFMQISNKWQGAKLQTYRWRDPYDEARMARLVFDEAVRYFAKDRGPLAGFTPWHPFNKGMLDGTTQWGGGDWYLHLPAARVGIKSPFPPVNTQTTGWRTT